MAGDYFTPLEDTYNSLVMSLSNHPLKTLFIITIAAIAFVAYKYISSFVTEKAKKDIIKTAPAPTSNQSGILIKNSRFKNAGTGIKYSGPHTGIPNMEGNEFEDVQTAIDLDTKD